MSHDALLASGIEFDGILNCKCDLKISGQGSGNIISLHTVVVDSKGLYEGKIIAKELIIKGKVKGIVEADSIKIEAGGKFKGELTCKLLSIDTKGCFEGKSTMIIEKKDDKKKQQRMQEPITDDILL